MPLLKWRGWQWSTGSRFLGSALLAILVLAVHAPHFAGPVSEATPTTHPDHHLHAPLPAEEYPIASDCSLPEASLPILDDVLGDLESTSSGAMFPLIHIVLDDRDVSLDPPRASRPPGPTRHAILQRFIL